jgi:four helix bundle protein
MDKKYLTLSDISAYKIAFELSNYIWKVVINWDHYTKDTVGRQYVKSTDSVSANLAEGFGRYGKKDKIMFYRFSYGSIKESIDWTEKSKIRGLLTDEEYNHITGELNKLPREVNNLIKFTKDRLTI